MTELANLPALTAEELDVLADALHRLGHAIEAEADRAITGHEAERAHELGLRRAIVRSLVTAVAEAGYSLGRGVEPQGPGVRRRPSGTSGTC